METENALINRYKDMGAERKRERDLTNPMNIVWLSEVAINPVDNVQCSVCTASSWTDCYICKEGSLSVTELRIERGKLKKGKEL